MSTGAKFYALWSGELHLEAWSVRQWFHFEVVEGLMSSKIEDEARRVITSYIM